MKQEVRVSRLRTERDEKVQENYDKLVAARQGLDGLQGAKGGYETAFVSGTAPRNPKRLVEQMAQSVTLLNEPAVEPSEPRVEGRCRPTLTPTSAVDAIPPSTLAPTSAVDGNGRRTFGLDASCRRDGRSAFGLDTCC